MFSKLPPIQKWYFCWTLSQLSCSTETHSEPPQSFKVKLNSRGQTENLNLTNVYLWWINARNVHQFLCSTCLINDLILILFCCLWGLATRLKLWLKPRASHIFFLEFLGEWPWDWSKRFLLAIIENSYFYYVLPPKVFKWSIGKVPKSLEADSSSGS